MREDRERWDRRHREGVLDFEPNRFLRENIGLLPPGDALDLACGNGRNSLFLAERGYRVTAVDISPEGISQCIRRARGRGLKVNAVVADLERFAIPEGRFDLIVDLYYLQRSLIPQIKTGLRPGGMVLFETFTVDQAGIGHPSNPDYLLKHNELLKRFRDFRILFYRETLVGGHAADAETATASLIARKPAGSAPQPF